jgi:hypothetical protein
VEEFRAHMTFFENLREVRRLLDIHTEFSGSSPGYKHNVEVLNKSAIVLLVACWEAFNEDLAEVAFEILLDSADDPSIFPTKVLAMASKQLKESKDDDRDVWALSGAGWKNVLKNYKESIFARYIGRLNTPHANQIDKLYESLLGIPSISRNWYWPGMTVENAVKKLENLIEVRGSISHRVSASQKVHKNTVREYIHFINRIAIKNSNALRALIIERTGNSPWIVYTYSPPSI